MSAIIGLYDLAKNPVSDELIDKMINPLRKFPLDDIGVTKSEYLFFGNWAQWITPEQRNEPMPFYDSERKLLITADAIIDNRVELFERLQIPISYQSSIPDSQLILLAYEKWGEDSPKYLLGDFAYMIWDEKAEKMFGARDFSGGRTFYYANVKGIFSFSTIINPILSLPHIENDLNEQWLAQFLVIAGMVDVADTTLTPYKYINQLPPFHSITVTREKTTVKAYGLLNHSNKLKYKTSKEYIEHFQHTFQLAIDSRLRTFKKVGSQLSGGLDSGAIVGFAGKKLKNESKPLHTLSYVPLSSFKDYTAKDFLADESPFMKKTVHFVKNINDYYYDFEGRDSFSEIDSFLEILEMPYKFFENSFWLKGMFEKAKEHEIGILLNGGRGNLSISWGSALHYYAKLLKNLRWIQLAKELHMYSLNAGGPRFRLLPYLINLNVPFLFKEKESYEKPCLINENLALKTSVFEKLATFGIGKEGWFSSNNIYLQRYQHFNDLFHWNASNTLATKLSLVYGLWKRDPTNDLRVIKFCLSVPEDQYVGDGLDRKLIREATKGYLPDEVRLNQKVRGVQGVDWIDRIGEKWSLITKEMNQLLEDEQLFHYIDKTVLENIIKVVRDQGFDPKRAGDGNYKSLMHAIIIQRFLQQYT
ncbi:asparagine synthase-related protein [Bacillus carboniphilus]|uniref:asparagine synthase (glutamine-hydrolyzing) n=1 Tax=Bacillus carboniphilus TaxID=86663 RepID=A0ABY9JTN9_9BACI|nr:asparagine synthase-related protein [Bacillus carboniphilus]WLR42772.1 asparagine synthase-related protein [Bacillus carboniphilus]